MTRHPPRRAYALVLAVLLAVVGGIIVALLLERQAAQSLTVARDVAAYRSRHFERGVREVVGQWADTLGAQISTMTDTDGHALDLGLPGGEVVSVYLFDGQGSMLSDPAGRTELERTDLQGALQALGNATGWNPDPAILRPVGPVAVSAATAPPEVLAAIATFAGSRDPAAFVETILSARASAEGLQDSDLETAKNRANLAPDQRAVLSRLVTTRPTLWSAVIDVYAPGSGIPVVRYGARFDLGGTTSAGGLLQSLGRFLSWEELPVLEMSGN